MSKIYKINYQGKTIIINLDLVTTVEREGNSLMFHYGNQGNTSVVSENKETMDSIVDQVFEYWKDKSPD
jgi:hypothetical protein